MFCCTALFCLSLLFSIGPGDCFSFDFIGSGVELMVFFVPERVYFIEGLIAYLLICLVVLFVWLLSVIMCYMYVCH